LTHEVTALQGFGVRDLHPCSRPIDKLNVDPNLKAKRHDVDDGAGFSVSSVT
jgi:hypothetical protein